jgi:hypothetical protein
MHLGLRQYKLTISPSSLMMFITGGTEPRPGTKAMVGQRHPRTKGYAMTRVAPKASSILRPASSVD